LARVSYMGSTRAKARRRPQSNGPLFHRCVAPFYSGIDTGVFEDFFAMLAGHREQTFYEIS
jgi:hypothetical protein